MSDVLQSTPFHARAVEANCFNAWETRRGYTLASHYTSADEEAVAARFGAVLADLSWQWRVVFAGGDIEAFVDRAFTRGGAAMALGSGCDVLWLNDGGAVRGRGYLVRLGADRFLLLSPGEDRDWLDHAAGLYGVSCYDQSADDVGAGLLALIGPAAVKLLCAAGLEADAVQTLAPGGFIRLTWRGLTIAVSRLGLGFEVWCAADDALIVWDRLMAAGRSYAVLAAGQTALDTLAFEAGMLVAERDFTPARDGFCREPSPQGLGLCGVVDPERRFNGKAAYLANGAPTRLVGLILEGAATAAPVAPGPITHPATPAGRAVGQLLATRVSPALQGVLGLAILEESCPADGLVVGHFAGRALGLPFLPIPQPLESVSKPTEAAQAGV